MNTGFLSAKNQSDLPAVRLIRTVMRRRVPRVEIVTSSSTGRFSASSSTRKSYLACRKRERLVFSVTRDDGSVVFSIYR